AETMANFFILSFPFLNVKLDRSSSELPSERNPPSRRVSHDSLQDAKRGGTMSEERAQVNQRA
ncbi:MAG: hypothetical protein ACKOEW_09630, partial [Methylocystis sp.]